MYAVIETGGKQYRVQEGDTIFIEKLGAEEGETVTFDKVVALGKDDGFVAGAPYVDGAKVSAKVVKNGKAKKVIVYKYKAKKNYHQQNGSQAAIHQGADRKNRGLIVIKARFITNNSVVCGFEISGHAGYADKGNDIVCASVSSAVQMAANTIIEVIGAGAYVSRKGGKVTLAAAAMQ